MDAAKSQTKHRGDWSARIESPGLPSHPAPSLQSLSWGSLGVGLPPSPDRLLASTVAHQSSPTLTLGHPIFSRTLVTACPFDGCLRFPPNNFHRAHSSFPLFPPTALTPRLVGVTPLASGRREGRGLSLSQAHPSSAYTKGNTYMGTSQQLLSCPGPGPHS